MTENKLAELCLFNQSKKKVEYFYLLLPLFCDLWLLLGKKQPSSFRMAVVFSSGRWVSRSHAAFLYLGCKKAYALPAHTTPGTVAAPPCKARVQNPISHPKNLVPKNEIFYSSRQA